MTLSALFRAYQAAPSPETALPLAEHLGPATAGIAQKLHELLVAHRSALVLGLTDLADSLQVERGAEDQDALALTRTTEILLGEEEV